MNFYLDFVFYLTGLNSFTRSYLAEHFNVLWKENWTLEAERVLKAFEKDVIKKVVCIKFNDLYCYSCLFYVSLLLVEFDNFSVKIVLKCQSVRFLSLETFSMI